MESKLLEDLEQLSIFRKNLLEAFHAETGDVGRSRVLEAYIQTLTKSDRTVFFDKTSDDILRLLSKYRPLLLRAECMRNSFVLDRVQRRLRKKDPKQAVFLHSLETNGTSKDAAYKAAISSGSISTFLYFCDIFSEPASAPKAALRAEASEDDIIYAIQQNADRANIKTLEKFFFDLKNRDRLTRTVIEKILISIRLIDSRHELVPELMALYADCRAVEGSADEVESRLIFECSNMSKLECVASHLDLEMSALLQNSIENRSPELFRVVAGIMLKNRDMASFHNLAMGRLKNFKNSFAASNALVIAFTRAQAFVPALGILERISSKHPYDASIEYRLATTRASLGDWTLLSRELKHFQKIRPMLRSDRPLHAIGYMFTVDACPSLTFGEKYNVYKDIAEGKNVRSAPPFFQKRKKISLIGGDFRQHAMQPILRLVADALANLAPVEIISTCPTSIEDKATEAFEEKYEFKRLNLSMNQDEARELMRETLVAFDMAQYTEYNALNFFRRGLSPIQVSSFWASGFITPESCMDYTVIDDYAFKNFCEEGHVAQKFLRVSNSMAIEPTQLLQWQRPNSANFTVGVFARPLRYSRKLFETLSELISGNVVDRVLFSHSYLQHSQSKDFLSKLLAEYDIPSESYTISSASLRNDVLLVDAAIDTAPIGSPTTTRDLLFAGLPVFVFDGNDVFSRLSPAFLHYIGREELLWKSVDQLSEALGFVKARGVDSRLVDPEIFARSQGLFGKSLTNAFERLLMN